MWKLNHRAFRHSSICPNVQDPVKTRPYQQCLWVLGSQPNSGDRITPVQKRAEPEGLTRKHTAKKILWHPVGSLIEFLQAGLVPVRARLVRAIQPRKPKERVALHAVCFQELGIALTSWKKVQRIRWEGERDGFDACTLRFQKHICAFCNCSLTLLRSPAP